MNLENQRDLAEKFQALHVDTNRDPLVLANSWDVASTIIYEEVGFKAVGTSSAGIAATLGYPDGEYLDRRQMVTVIDRIRSQRGHPSKC